MYISKTHRHRRTLQQPKNPGDHVEMKVEDEKRRTDGFFRNLVPELGRKGEQILFINCRGSETIWDCEHLRVFFPTLVHRSTENGGNYF